MIFTLEIKTAGALAESTGLVHAQGDTLILLGQIAGFRSSAIIDHRPLTQRQRWFGHPSPTNF